MTTITRRRSAAAAIGAAAVLLAPAAGAVAAPAAATSEGAATASVGRLVLEPSTRGYQGDLPITITNDSDRDVSHVLITEPVAGSWRGTVSNEFCMVAVPKQYVRTFDCAVPVGPGKSYPFTARFEVLTRTRPFAMSVDGGQVAVQVGYESPVTTTTSFRTVFRSTTGSLTDPRPYVQDSSAQASIKTGEAQLNRQADGSYAGWLPVTVRYRSDAPHNYLNVRAALPAGMDIVDMDPADLPVFADGFVVPGGAFMEGERRTFRVLLTAPAGADPGTLGTGSFTLEVFYEGGPVADRRPADNTVSFAISAVDAS